MIKINRRLVLALVAALVVAAPATPAFACPAGYTCSHHGGVAQWL